MSPSKKALPRRTFLQGAGVTIALPFLDAMIPTFANAQSSTAPMRALISLGGTCQTSSTIMTPKTTGVLPTSLGTAFSSLEAVRQHVSLISALAMPTYQTGTPPPGAVYNAQHYVSTQPLMTGRPSADAKPLLMNHTVDQIIADLIGTKSRIKSLQVRTQAVGYNGSAAERNGYMSARQSGSTTAQQLFPIVNPAKIFDTLFAGGVPSSGGGGGTPTPSLAVRRQQSILDFVLGDANRMMASLDSNDKARLDQHFTEIRELEKRLAPPVSPTTPSNACTAPAKPGADTPPNQLGFGGWANEDKRADLQVELMAMAFACDITRVVSWLITQEQCFLQTQYIHGEVSDMHNLTHFGTPQQLAAHVNWHAGKFAKLVKRLSEIPEAGGTVLDNTFMTLMFTEGTGAHGRGYYNYVIAGRPSKLKIGQHIAGAGAHPAKMLIAGMQSIGLTNNTLGDLSGPLAAIMK